MSTIKNLSVSNLIRKFNILLNTRNYQILPLSCNCIFRMCNNENGIGTNIKNECPVHKNNKFICMLLKKFAEKNLLYITTQYNERILYDKQLHMMLPLIINLHTDKFGICHFFNKKTPLKLNNIRVKFTNLLIFNLILCERKYCNNHNNLLKKFKIINFKYAIFINCLKKPNKYIDKIPNKSIFAFKLSKFIGNVD
mgnify:CR=1 FL=1